MYLKRLQMRGFKTFAQRTEIQLEPGLTAVVGPNGVGKSNIADAIIWSLGEQSNRAIRAQTSQDVIFAGSDTRSPLGMAEVRLTVDNSDGALPIDFAEVEVCRRVYRTGESEYAINNASCRLRDIHDLFVDTGVGQAAYSLVTQGEIDAILSARSEDRRELIEEVAGIGKYRRRRKETRRKLEETEANVRRISDIVYELTSQREPLEEQAVKARQYRGLDDSLRELELKLLALDYQQRRGGLGKLVNDQHVGAADRESTRSQVTLLEAEAERLATALHRLEAKLEQARQEALEAEREAERTDRAHAVTGEKLRAAQERLQDLDRADEGDGGREQELDSHLREFQEQRAEIRQAREQLAQELDALRHGLAEAQAQQEAQVQRVQTLEREQQELARGAELQEREAEALAGIQEELGERVQRLITQGDALQRRRQEAARNLQQTRARRDELAGQVQETRRQLAEQARLHQDLTRTLRDHRAKRAILAGAATAAETRLALLEELARSHEGYDTAVQQVLAAAQAGELTGVRGVVGELMEVPARYEQAIEAALGDKLQWIVTDTQDQALAAVEFLRARGAGWATFLPLSSLSAVAPRATAPAGPGCLGVATRLVRPAHGMTQIIEHLLGDVVIMSDLPAALRCMRRLGPQARAITLRGEVVERSGAIRGGAAHSNGVQAFGRGRELEQVRDQVAQLKRSLAAMWEREERLERSAQTLAGRLEQANDGAGEGRAELSQLDRDLVHLSEQVQITDQANAETEAETHSLRTRLQETSQREQAARRRAAELRARADAVAADLEQARAQQHPAEQLEQQRAGLVQKEVMLAELREKERSVEALVAQAEEELSRLRRDRESVTETTHRLRAQIEELTAELQRLGDDLGRKRDEAERLRGVVSGRLAKVDELRDKAEQLEASRRELRRLLDEQNERLQRTELSLTREQAQLESIQERLADVYEVTPGQAVALLEDEQLNRGSLAREVNRLKREIRALGHVNLSAIAEVERLSARESFLKEQREDLESARADLVRIIDEIDTAAEQELLAALDQIAEEFNSIFAQLFGGGSTQLWLTDPQHPLESGVEVLAQPPGKRQKNLVSLSGGERAMTALALLFAMLKVRPSPFCVLDEIDAALDPNNTDRFVELLTDFAQRSQIIVITHNPRTMEAADVLHGVTMQEPGVSQRISVELEEAQRQAEERAKAERERAAREASGRQPVPEEAAGSH